MPRIVLSGDRSLNVRMHRLSGFHAAWDRARTEDETEQAVDAFARELAAEAESSGQDLSSPGVLGELKQTLRYLRPVPAEQFRERITICAACEHSRQMPVPGNDKAVVVQCRKCGCIMNAKARLTGGQCPLGKFA